MSFRLQKVVLVEERNESVDLEISSLDVAFFQETDYAAGDCLPELDAREF